MAGFLDWLLNQNDDTYKPDDYQETPSADDTKNNPPQGGRSELIGNLMQGIPKTNGYPITDEDMSPKAATPAAEPQTPAAPAKVATTSAKTIQPFQGIDTSKVLKGSDDVINAAKAAKPDDSEPSTDTLPQAKSIDETSASTQSEAPKSALEQYLDQLRDAQQKQQDTLTGLNRTEGIAQILGGLARAPVQGGFLDDQRKQAALPVQNVEQNIGLQEAINQEQQNKQSMALRQKTADQEAQMNSMKLEQLTNSLNDEKALRDPNSDASEALRTFQRGRLAQLNMATGKAMFDPGVVDSMSGEQIEKTFGKTTPEQVADTFIKSQASRDNAAASREMRQLAMQQGMDKHQDTVDWHNNMIQTRQDSMDRNEHKQVLNNLVKDKNINKYIANYGNMNQVISKMQDPNVPVTPQLLSEMQSIVNQSMGNITAGGVNERHARDIVENAGLDWTRFKNYITSKPGEVSPDQQKQMFAYFKPLLDNEQVTTGAVVRPILDRLSAGHKSMYERRPDLQNDLKDALDANTQLFDQHIQMPANMTGRNMGMAQVTPAPAAQATQPAAPQLPPPHPQDNDAIAWAKANPNDPRSKQILQLNGM